MAWQIWCVRMLLAKGIFSLLLTKRHCERGTSVAISKADIPDGLSYVEIATLRSQ